MYLGKVLDNFAKEVEKEKRLKNKQQAKLLKHSYKNKFNNIRK